MTIPGLIESRLTIPFGDKSLGACLICPEGEGPFPAILAIHEIFGLGESLLILARQLAGEGYAVLAVDLYSAGNKAVCVWQCIKSSMDGSSDNPPVRALKAGADYLAGLDYIDAKRIGAIGFCMGGNFALALAWEDKRMKTVAPFYSNAVPKTINTFRGFCPVVGSYPGRDFTAKIGRKLWEDLSEAGVPNDIKIYPGTIHGFANSALPIAYNAEATRDAMERVISFFGKYL